MTITRAPQIQTFTGKNVNFLDPKPETIDIKDIAHALALCNRYTGHTPRPYSVAQHSVLASYAAPYELAFEALMHDAQEAYVGDCATTLKQLLQTYKVIEGRLEAVVRKKYGLPVEMTPAVKVIDSRMLKTEAKYFGFSWWDQIDVPLFEGMDIDAWDWTRARDSFMSRFYQLAPIEVWD